MEEGPFEHSLEEKVMEQPDGTLRIAGTKEEYLIAFEKFLNRDKEREKDGFKRKIKLTKYSRPAKGGNKVVVLPAAQPDKFHHRPNPPTNGDIGEGTGTGSEQVGDVIDRGQPGQDRPGKGVGDDGEDHGIELDPQELGKLITEQFNLPNLKQKGRKRSLVSYKYELNAMNRKAGQLLDRKKTVTDILKRNIALGRVDDVTNIDTSKLIISPEDFHYRVMSRERTYESEAVVFFARDYSGSMIGERTEMLISQHIMLYCWLHYQYKGRVQTRFVLHDTQAKEVPTFDEYYRMNAGGGTYVASAYKYINEVIKAEDLVKDKNIYVFHGTDGDDVADTKEAVKELARLVRKTNLTGITITNESPYSTTVEEYAKPLTKMELYKNKLKISRIKNSSDEEIFRSMREMLT